MNIFYLSADPVQCAIYHGDIHVNKMLVETAQMLSTSHYIASSPVGGLYKPTHPNHPCSVWVRENTENYHWAWQLLKALCVEFQVRRGKIHATQRLVLPLETLPDIPYASDCTPPVLAMPDEHKGDCPIASYRRYYRQKHAEGIVSYDWSAQRNIPEWLKGVSNE